MGPGILSGTAGRMWPEVDSFSKRHTGNTSLVLLPAFAQCGGCASAERVSRDQPAERMQVQTGPEGGNSLDELKVMSEWDAEPFSQNQEKSYNLQKGED